MKTKLPRRGLLATVAHMKENTAALLKKIATELTEGGVPIEKAKMVATSVVIKGLMEAGMDMKDAYEMCFGAGHWEAMLSHIEKNLAA
jgi:hypothetical protein